MARENYFFPKFFFFPWDVSLPNSSSVGFILCKQDRGIDRGSGTWFTV